MRRDLVRACSLFMLAACSRATSGNVNVLAARVTTLADSVFAARLVFDRGFGTQAGLAGADHNGLPDNTPGGIRNRQARADTLRMAVVAIEPAPLEGRPEAVLDAMMRESLDAEQQLRVCPPLQVCCGSPFTKVATNQCRTTAAGYPPGLRPIPSSFARTSATPLQSCTGSSAPPAAGVAAADRRAVRREPRRTDRVRRWHGSEYRRPSRAQSQNGYTDTSPRAVVRGT